MYSVLVVENNELFRKSFREVLQMHLPSLLIEEASNGVEALQKIGAHTPDIAFVDIHMSGQNGLELTKEIKARYPQVVVIMLTSYDLPEYREMAFKFGADHFLLKDSLTGANIAALVKSILSNQSSFFKMVSIGYPCSTTSRAH